MKLGSIKGRLTLAVIVIVTLAIIASAAIVIFIMGGNLTSEESSTLKLQAGVEDYIRNSTLRFAPYCYNLDYNIFATHIDAQWRIVPKVFLNVSARMEMMERSCQFMPRATLSYIPNKQWQFSFVAGKYSQKA